MTIAATQNPENATGGKVTAVRGAVVDVGFTGGMLPAVEDAVILQFQLP